MEVLVHHIWGTSSNCDPNQVDKSVLPSLKKIAESYSANGTADEDDDDSDDDVPDLVENFESATQ